MKTFFFNSCMIDMRAGGALVFLCPYIRIIALVDYNESFRGYSVGLSLYDIADYKNVFTGKVKVFLWGVNIYGQVTGGVHIILIT